MANEIPLRSQVQESDKWDLTSLYPCDEAWETDLAKLQKKITEAGKFQGTLGKSPENLLEAMKWISDAFMLAEQVYVYASLKSSAESNDPENQRKMGVISQVYTDLVASVSYMDPEILEIKNIEKWIQAKEFDESRIYLKKILRQKDHTLSPKEEEILAKQSELQGTPQRAFGMLTNVDLDFGKIDDAPLSQGTWGSFMINPDRDVRRRAYEQFYKTYEKHEQTIATLYAGSVKQDIFNARIRGFDTALDAALYRDDVPKSVYTGLIEAVHKAFPALHRYYALRKKIMGVDELRHYDVYVPLVSSIKTHKTYEEATEIIREALAPLGEEYVKTIYKGLTTDRWVDRYENKGKRSGAFSSGGFIGAPYILMNYKEDVLGDVFTLAHEGGHSMHSYYSKRNNPYLCYDYTIFEAEVASTFNEQLVARYFIDHAESKEMKTYIIAKQIDDIIATLFRQTMFAEFELLCHTQQENGQPLTASTMRKTYRGLLEAYFGPEMKFEENSDMEGLRIPHFYNAYYVYKYSTGISAAIALSERVLNGGKAELEDYLGFLKSGGSKFPIDTLKGAGVDMSTQAPVEAATKKFAALLDEFEKLIG
ncbi:MAG: oligoendopeptidase F [Sphaerochaetaceae bacterium]|nr:oligoendopeptidase F [Sphaerochaetaceae bacterium]